MLKFSHIASCSVFLLAVSAGCSTSTTSNTGTTGGSPCMPACGANSTCNADGTCSCYPNYNNCPGGDAGAVCVQVLLDNNNCGGCGIVCPSGESCLGGACTCHLTTCQSGDAGAVCTDPESDPLNCGMCGHACPTGENCVLGECSCMPSLTIAQCTTDGGLACVDLTTDDNNCGGCGIMCAANQHCAAPGGAGGVCVCDVDAGPGEPLLPIDNCGGTCQDTTSDPFNCGGCGNVCVSGSCILGDAGAGICNCPLPYTQCGPDCVDTYSDINHCGSCDNDCTIVGAGLTELNCNLGHCYCGATGQGTICPDGTCSTLGRDPNNCGACGNVCLAPAQDCDNGTCVCPDSESLCGSPDAGIPLFCINTTEDGLNCGNCGNVCNDTYAGNSGCRFGLCTCSPGQTQLCATSSPGGALPTCNCVGDNVNGGKCNTLSFAADVYPLLAQQTGSFGCSASGCHGGPNPAAGLAFLDSNFHMDAGMAFAELLDPPPPSGDAGSTIPYCDGGVPADAPASQCGCVSRILPGNHNGSYLIDVLLNDIPGQCSHNSAMPIDDAGSWTPLGSCEQQLMQQWIDTGAAP
jgi:hypothetical protein